MKYLVILAAFLSLSLSAISAEIISVNISVKEVLDMPSSPENYQEDGANVYYKISQTLKQDSKVKVSIESKDGKEIKVLFDGKADAGDLHVAWDCDDDDGASVGSGDYKCIVQVNEEKSEKLISLK